MESGGGVFLNDLRWGVKGLGSIGDGGRIRIGNDGPAGGIIFRDQPELGAGFNSNLFGDGTLFCY